MFQSISVLGGECEAKKRFIEELKRKLHERGYNVLLVKKADEESRKLRIQFGGLMLEKEVKIDEPNFLSQIAVRYAVDVFLSTEEIGPALRIVSATSKGDLKLAETKKPTCIVTNLSVKCSVPMFKFNEADSLAKFLDEKYLKKILGDKVNLEVNGKFIPINPFVREVIRNVVTALISSLKGTEEAREIILSVKK